VGAGRGVFFGHRVAHANLEAAVAAEAQSGQRGGKGALLAAEAVMRVGDSVEADADVVEAGVGDGVDVVRVDQRAVGRKRGVEAHRLAAPGDVEKCPGAAAVRHQRE